MSLRPLWKLSRLTQAVFRRRWNVLRESRWISWILTGLLIPPVLVAWEILTDGKRRPAALAVSVLLIAQLAVWLHLPAMKRRKAACRPVPVFYLWLVQVVCLTGALALKLRSEQGDPDPLFIVAVLLAVLSLLATALPFLLRLLSSGVRRLGIGLKLRRLRLSRSSAYAVLVAGSALGAAVLIWQRARISRVEAAAFALSVLLGAVLAISYRGRLWDRRSELVPAVLPQMIGWAALLALLQDPQKPSLGLGFFGAVLALVLLHTAWQKLRRSPLWRLNWFTGALLRRRWRELCAHPGALWTLVLLLIPTILLASVVKETGKPGGTVWAYPGAVVLLVAQLAGWLHHPFRRRRKAARHSLPAATFWLIQILAIAQIVFAITPSISDVREPVLVGLQGERPSAVAPAVVWLLAVLSFAATVLPPLLSYVSSTVRRLGIGLRLRWLRLSTPSLYGLVLAAAAVWAGTSFGVRAAALHLSISRPALTVGLFVGLGVALRMRRRLWNRHVKNLGAALPQALGWAALLALPRVVDQPVAVTLFFLSILLLAGIHWTYLRLRYSPVEKDREKIGDEALSVQTDPSRYVDTNDHGAQLIRFIERSDGGVIGLTGVRGAGKSALIAHVLAELQRKHLTLAMTAPIRHDPGIAFLMTVCRAVCRRIVDDTNHGLYGRTTEMGRARVEILRRLRNLGVVAALIGLGYLGWLAATPRKAANPIRTAARQPPFYINGADWEDSNCFDALEFERQTVDDLIAKIDALSPRGTGALDGARYLIVPQCDGKNFLLLREYADSASLDLLRNTYQSCRPEPESLNRQLYNLWTQEFITKTECHAEWRLLHHQIQAVQRELLPKPAPVLAVGVPTVPEPTLVSVALLQGFLQYGSSLDGAGLLRLQEILQDYRGVLGQEEEEKVGGIELKPSGLSLESWAVAVPAIVASLLVAAVIWRFLSALARAVVNWRFVALYREAGQFLETLNFSESRQTSGGLSWKWFSLERSRSLAERDLTLPGLTSRYVDFVQSARGFYNGKLILAIDELDKIQDPDMVKSLLTEIKGALFTKGCYYLISISEDATRSFRQRLSSGRDIFESTFDEVIEIPRMNVESASRMIEKRQEKTPPARRVPRSCWYVLVLCGGGIPREIVRHLRTVSMKPKAGGLEPRTVALELMRSELKLWMARLGEVELPGAETVKLRGLAKQALAAVEAALAGEACGGVWEHLEASLALLDPECLRASFLKLPGRDEKSLPENILRYQALEDDIQACLRLMILATVCDLACSGDGSWAKPEERILDAYGALADKPALAEEMLQEIRTEIAARGGLPPTGAASEAALAN